MLTNKEDSMLLLLKPEIGIGIEKQNNLGLIFPNKFHLLIVLTIK